MTNQQLRVKANTLADKAISNPSLLNQLDDDNMIKFAIGVSKYNKDKAVKLIDLRYPNVVPHNIVLFWQAVGILQKPDDFA